MLYDSAIIDSICASLVKYNFTGPTSLYGIVEKQCSVERTRGGKRKVLGFNKTILERKNANHFDEVALALGPEIVRASEEEYYKSVLGSKISQVLDLLLVVLRHQYPAAVREVSSRYDNGIAVQALRDQYVGEGRQVEFTDAAGNQCSLEIKAMWKRDQLDAEPQYHVQGHCYSSAEPKRGSDGFAEMVKDTGNLAVDLVTAVTAGMQIVKAKQDQRAAARDVLQQFNQEFPQDNRRFTPGFSLDVGSAERDSGKVHVQVLVHCVASKLAETLALLSSDAPQAFQDMTQSLAQALASGACGWRQGSLGDDQMHFSTAYGRFDIGLSSRFDRADVMPEGSTELLLTVRWTGDLLLASALTLARYLTITYPAAR